MLLGFDIRFGSMFLTEASVVIRFGRLQWWRGGFVYNSCFWFKLLVGSVAKSFQTSTAQHSKKHCYFIVVTSAREFCDRVNFSCVFRLFNG